jgi:hypothetical protein
VDKLIVSGSYAVFGSYEIVTRRDPVVVEHQFAF